MGARTTDTTGFQRASIADALFETNYQPNLAQELWLNLGGKEYRLIGKSIRIGRALDNDIVIEDRSCSRYHAIISMMDGNIFLEDLKSRNGVVVNGYKITNKHVLDDNDQIEVGDLKGVFFRRHKNRTTQKNNSATESTDISGAKKIDLKKLVVRFQLLPKPVKLSVVALTPLILMLMFVAFSGSSSSSQVTTASPAPKVKGFSLNQEDIVNAKIDKEAFNRCIELEDLGIYQQARSCLQKLPLNSEVYSALKRVNFNQEHLSKTRFEEGLKAFNNYYYDLAILKWQEVLLIADQQSEIALKAKELIDTARRSRRSL